MFKHTVICFIVFCLLLVNCVNVNALPLNKYDKYYVFWKEEIEKLNDFDFNFSKVFNPKYSSSKIDVYDISFNSIDNIKITGYLSIPHGDGPFPAIIVFHGMGTSFNDPFLNIAREGFIVCSIDLRGYGKSEGNIRYTVEMPTIGITNKDNYVFKDIILDAYRTVDVINSISKVDKSAITVRGTSMGGGICLILAALNPKISYVLSDIPYFCDMENSIYLAKDQPYIQIKKYIEENPQNKYSVLRTLLYYDVKSLGKFINSNKKILVTGGINDTVCPVEGIKAAVETIKANKSFFMSQGRGHNYGGQELIDFQLKWLKKKIEISKDEKD